MPLTNSQLRNYDSTVLRLPADKRKEYHAQVDRLIANLSKHIKDRSDIKITRVVKAGSFAKFTILRKTANDPIDADVVFYICGKSADQETLGSLNDLIYEVLVAVYPTKSVEDFEIQRRAAKVTFKGTGLSVDIVPVIEDPSRPGYGWQYDISDGTKVQTCAPCAIKFVRDRKDVDPDFRTLVRMAKRWRNYAELFHLKSFVIELIMAHVLAKYGHEGTVEERFRRFLWYVASSGLKERLQFPENTAPIGDFSDPVVILDPVSSLNNVASRITEAERLEIIAAAKESWEAAHFASAEDDYDAWKDIFGPGFKVED
jgi:tRNA nucleotidyltransferase (CCA-adding enzyme)